MLNPTSNPGRQEVAKQGLRLVLRNAQQSNEDNTASPILPQRFGVRSGLHRTCKQLRQLLLRLHLPLAILLPAAAAAAGAAAGAAAASAAA